MKRTDFGDKSLQEVSEELEKEFNEFKTKVTETKVLDDLKKMEEDLIKDMEEFDEYLNGALYELPDNIEFEGKVRDRKYVGDAIVYFINKCDVEWKAVLGLHQMVNFWKSNPEKIHYKVYDSTLRALNTLKFQGQKEWTDILTINDYMASAHENYARDNEYLYFLSQKHNEIMNQMALVATPEEAKELNLPQTNINDVTEELQ